jgi:hypothetical protein
MTTNRNGSGGQPDSQKPSGKNRRASWKSIRTDDPGLEVVHPNAAGIDVGNVSFRQSCSVAVGSGCF